MHYATKVYKTPVPGLTKDYPPAVPEMGAQSTVWYLTANIRFPPEKNTLVRWLFADDERKGMNSIPPCTHTCSTITDRCGPLPGRPSITETSCTAPECSVE